MGARTGIEWGPLRRVAAVGAVAFACVLWPLPANADFAAGVAAYEAGDFATAFEEWLPEAEAGNDAAQRNIGLLYQSGRGVEADISQAVFWYQRAAEAGNARAQANLGNLYLAGNGVPQDNTVAANWFELAARQSHVVSQFNLGLMYENGIGVAVDRNRALNWYAMAAEAGHQAAIDQHRILLAQAAPDPVPSPLPAPAAAPVAAPGAEPEPVIVAEPIPEPEQIPEPEPIPEPAPAPLPTPEPAVAAGPIAAPAPEVAILAPPLPIPEPAAEPERQPPAPALPVPPPALLVEEAARLVEEAARLAEKAANLGPAVMINLDAIPEPEIPNLLVAEAEAAGDQEAGLIGQEAAAEAVENADPVDPEPPGPEQVTEKRSPIVVPETLAGIEVAENPGIAGLIAYRRGDYLTALANLLPAAVQGDPSAQFLLGGMYRDGAGIPPDLPQAYLWWTLASGQGHLEATQFLAKLRGEMAEDDLARAVELLEVWVERR